MDRSVPTYGLTPWLASLDDAARAAWRDHEDRLNRECDERNARELREEREACEGEA
jgi:hypothetical protein